MFRRIFNCVELPYRFNEIDCLMEPLVSVVMSVHNGDRFLIEAIESILVQTYKNIEFIIIDDSSDDHTPFFLKKYAEQDSRIVVLRNEKNLGLTKSLNKGIKISRGTFIARQDADDFSHPERIAKQIEFMLCNPNIMLLGTGGYLIDEKGKTLYSEHVVTGKKRSKKIIKKRNIFFHGSVIIRKSCLDKTGLYNEEFRIGQDYDLFLRISESHDIENLEKPLYYYRIMPNTISSTKSREQQMATLIAQTASSNRVKGHLAAWELGTYQRYEIKLDTFLNNKIIESNIFLTKGRNNLLMNNIESARKEFAKAFIAFPTPKTLYHLIKSFLQCCKTKKSGM